MSDHRPSDRAMDDQDCFLVLSEETGEVARAILDSNRGIAESFDKHEKDLRKELIQVAAVCAAWVERLGRTAEESPGP